MTLTAKQRQHLKGLAHPLAPVVRVGKGRLTPSIVAETKRSLEAHELIKVRIESDDAAERRDIATRLAAETESELGRDDREVGHSVPRARGEAENPFPVARCPWQRKGRPRGRPFLFDAGVTTAASAG